MQINQLPTIPQAPADADVMAIEVNGATYKVSKQALASAILGQIGASDNVVDVDHGGTGATTAAAALTNIGALAAANVYNGLDKTASGFALDARQGKALNDTLSGKLNTANVYNGLDKTDSGFALDARQGKALNDSIAAITPASIGAQQTLQRYEYSFAVSATGATIGSRVNINTFELSTLGITRTDVKGLFVSGIQTNSAQAHAMPYVSHNQNRVYTAVYAASATVDITVYVTIIY